MIHRRHDWGEEGFRRRLAAPREQALRRGSSDLPPTQAATTLARRLKAHGESHSRFITEPGAGPTNNRVEQAIRFVVIDRLITQGTRGDSGDRRCKGIWTVMTTCAQQGRSVLEYLESDSFAWFACEEAPTLLPRAS